MTRKILSMVVMRFDANGDLSVHTADEFGSCVVLTVDERCPDDLVYEHLGRQSPEEVLALAPRPWGHAGDDKHEQATVRIHRALNGLSVIEGDQP